MDKTLEWGRGHQHLPHKSFWHQSCRDESDVQPRTFWNVYVFCRYAENPDMVHMLTHYAIVPNAMLSSTKFNLELNVQGAGPMWKHIEIEVTAADKEWRHVQVGQHLGSLMRICRMLHFEEQDLGNLTQVCRRMCSFRGAKFHNSEFHNNGPSNQREGNS